MLNNHFFFSSSENVSKLNHNSKLAIAILGLTITRCSYGVRRTLLKYVPHYAPLASM